MNLEEIEEKARYAFMNAKDVTLSKDEFNSLIAEVKRLREENERLKEDIKRFESFRQPLTTVHKDW